MRRNKRLHFILKINNSNIRSKKSIHFKLNKDFEIIALSAIARLDADC